MLKYIFTILFSLQFIMPTFAMAAVCDGDPNLELNSAGICVAKTKDITGVDCKGKDKGSIVCTDSVSSLVLMVLQYAFMVGGLVATIFIVFGGYIYMTAGGDDSAVASGKVYIQNAVVGLIITFIGWGIIRVVTSLLTQGLF